MLKDWELRPQRVNSKRSCSRHSGRSAGGRVFVVEGRIQPSVLQLILTVTVVIAEHKVVEGG